LYLDLPYLVFNVIFTVTYSLLVIYPKMSSVTTIRTILDRLGFSSAEATYLTGTCGSDSLDEIAYLDGIDDVDTTIKEVMNLVGMVTTGTGSGSVTSRNNGIPV
jgi:hypothetical protein